MSSSAPAVGSPSSDSLPLVDQDLAPRTLEGTASSILPPSPPHREYEPQLLGRRVSLVPPEDHQRPKHSKQDEVLGESKTPTEAVQDALRTDVVVKFTRFVRASLEEMTPENQNVAMDEIYAVLKKYRPKRGIDG
uniref:SAP30_Sin3_bdg domain-containing protein n=1 Tax=Steinernema glaseri TaxID=37863 RepID=A0A1I7Z2P6_9BILA